MVLSGRRPRRGRMAPVLAVGTVLAGCASLGGPPLALQGRVVDDATDRPLPYALVRLEDGTEARTNGRGELAIRELEPGRYRALIVVPGCRFAETELTVGAPGGGVVEIRAALPPMEVIPGDVPAPDESRGRVVTDREIVEMGAPRLSEVVRRVAPEMIGAPSGDPGRPAALRGRGAANTTGVRVPVLVVDGIVVHATNTYALDEIAVADVAWVEILPGAVAGWEYGTGGAGGVIRVQTKRGYRPSQDLDPEACMLPEEWS